MKKHIGKGIRVYDLERRAIFSGQKVSSWSSQDWLGFVVIINNFQMSVVQPNKSLLHAHVICLGWACGLNHQVNQEFRRLSTLSSQHLIPRSILQGRRNLDCLPAIVWPGSDMEQLHLQLRDIPYHLYNCSGAKKFSICISGRGGCLIVFDHFSVHHRPQDKQAWNEDYGKLPDIWLLKLKDTSRITSQPGICGSRQNCQLLHLQFFF